MPEPQSELARPLVLLRLLELRREVPEGELEGPDACLSPWEW